MSVHSKYLEGDCLYKHKQNLACKIADLGGIYQEQLAKGAKCSSETKRKLILSTALFDLLQCISMPEEYPTPIHAGVNPLQMLIDENDVTLLVNETNDNGFYIRQQFPAGDDSGVEFVITTSDITDHEASIGLLDSTYLSSFSAIGGEEWFTYSYQFNSGFVTRYKTTGAGTTTSVGAPITTYITGDKFRIEIDDDLILKFYKNDALIHTWDMLDEDTIYYLGGSMYATPVSVNNITYIFSSQPEPFMCLSSEDVCPIIDYMYLLTKETDFD